MTISPEAVRFDDDVMWVDLSDGRTIGVPLAWFPRLLHAAPVERCAYTLSRLGIHWETLHEDISVAGLLAGQGDRTGQGTPCPVFDAPVDIREEDGRVVIGPVRAAEFHLGDLLTEITKDNVHADVSSGEPFGDERL
ncbi:MAG: DUF2442 domain-containing protein [Litorimonas sp.]